MRTLVNRYAVSMSAAAALLAGCGGSQPPIGTSDTMQTIRAKASSYRVLYDFGGGPNGADPVANLVDVNGTLYGTTQIGGKYEKNGTAFKITTAGEHRVLHSFGNGSDGVSPLAGLVNVNGTLYGTTEAGGSGACRDEQGEAGCGVVFSLSETGKETVLYSFAGSSDGAFPLAGLVYVDGILYGTTVRGGASGRGTVFSVTTSGKETVLHSFSYKYGVDGALPSAGMVDVNGTLYGTTTYGGKRGAGTVFSITTSGDEHVLHSFGRPYDGAYPVAGLIAVKGILYGTTSEGGTRPKEGTVFSVTTDGKEHVVYSFTYGPQDGTDPQAGLIAMNGALYGTTVIGGQYNGGTVFSVTTGGKENVLHSFGGGYDGTGPRAGLIGVNGALYGTTCCGGTHHHDGTVFALSP